MKVIFDKNKLKTLRKESQLTQSVLAEASDMSDRYVRALESGHKQNPTAKMLYRMSRAMDVPMEAFLTAMPDEDDE